MITLYTTPTCSYCMMVKRVLDLKGKDYKLVNLEEDDQARQEVVKKTGSMRVPVVQVGEEYLTGWNPAKLNQLIEGV